MTIPELLNRITLATPSMELRRCQVVFVMNVDGITSEREAILLDLEDVMFNDETGQIELVLS